MIDIKALRDDPERFRTGVRLKRADVDIDALLAIDTRRRELTGAVEVKRAEQNKFSKEMGPELGRLKGQLKSATGAERTAIETKLKELERYINQLLEY